MSTPSPTSRLTLRQLDDLLTAKPELTDFLNRMIDNLPLRASAAVSNYVLLVPLPLLIDHQTDYLVKSGLGHVNCTRGYLQSLMENHHKRRRRLFVYRLVLEMAYRFQSQKLQPPFFKGAGRAEDQAEIPDPDYVGSPA